MLDDVRSLVVLRECFEHRRLADHQNLRQRQRIERALGVRCPYRRPNAQGGHGDHRQQQALFICFLQNFVDCGCGRLDNFAMSRSALGVAVLELVSDAELVPPAELAGPGPHDRVAARAVASLAGKIGAAQRAREPDGAEDVGYEQWVEELRAQLDVAEVAVAGVHRGAAGRACVFRPDAPQLGIDARSLPVAEA